jgi:hypothetical protein
MQPFSRYPPTLPYGPYLPGHFGGAAFSFAIPHSSGMGTYPAYPSHSAGLPTQLLVQNAPQPAPQPAPQTLKSYNPQTHKVVPIETSQESGTEDQESLNQVQILSQTEPLSTKPQGEEVTRAAAPQARATATPVCSPSKRESTGSGPFGFQLGGASAFPNKWSWEIKAEKAEREAKEKADREEKENTTKESIPDSELPLKEVAEETMSFLRLKADTPPLEQHDHTYRDDGTVGVSSRRDSSVTAIGTPGKTQLQQHDHIYEDDGTVSVPSRGGSNVTAVSTRGQTQLQQHDHIYEDDGTVSVPSRGGSNVTAVSTRAQTQLQLATQRARNTLALAAAREIPPAQQQDQKHHDAHQGSSAVAGGTRGPTQLQLALQRARNTMAHAAARERAKVAAPPAIPTPTKSIQEPGREQTVSPFLVPSTDKKHTPLVVRTPVNDPRVVPKAAVPDGKPNGVQVGALAPPAPAVPTAPVMPSFGSFAHFRGTTDSMSSTHPPRASEAKTMVVPTSNRPQPSLQVKPPIETNSHIRPPPGFSRRDLALMAAKPIAGKTVANPSATPSAASNPESVSMSAYPQFATSTALSVDQKDVQKSQKLEAQQKDVAPPFRVAWVPAKSNPGPSTSTMTSAVPKDARTSQELRGKEPLISAAPVPWAPAKGSHGPSTSTNPGPIPFTPLLEPFPTAQIPKAADAAYHEARYVTPPNLAGHSQVGSCIANLISRSNNVAVETRPFHAIADYYDGSPPPRMGPYKPLPDDWVFAYPLTSLTPTGRRRTDKELAKYLTKVDRDFYSGADLFGKNMHQVVEEVHARHINAIYLDRLGISRQENEARTNLYANLSKCYKIPTPWANMSIEEVMNMDKGKVVEPILTLLFRTLLLYRAEEGLPPSHRTWRSQFFTNSHPAIIKGPTVSVQEDEKEEEEDTQQDEAEEGDHEEEAELWDEEEKLVGSQKKKKTRRRLRPRKHMLGYAC